MASIVGRAVNRYISSTAPLGAATGHAASAGGHGGGHVLWKRLTFFVAFPAIGVTMLHCYLKHQEHEDRPEFRPYEHMRIRRKRFPWGDGQKTFFHNPHVNPLPDGYEDGH